MNKNFFAAILTLVIVAASVPAISADAADEYVYGTLSYLTYGEYFSSEFGTYSGVTGSYDTVTSATTNKSKQYANSYFTEDLGKVTISGIKNVPVKINKIVYDSAVAGTDYAQVKTLLDRGFTESATELTTYKEIASDGTIGQYQGLANTDVASDTKSLISTDTPWGNYVLEILSALSKATLTIDGNTVNNGASVMFNEDGTVNLDAKTKGKHSTTLFPDDKTYEVSLTVPGYGVVSGTVVKPYVASSIAVDTTVSNSLLKNNDVNDDSNDASVVADRNVKDVSKTTSAPKTSDSAMVFLGIIAVGIVLLFVSRRKKA